MENQHRKITGYRELSETEIELMNKLKSKAEECSEIISELESTVGIDKRSLAIGKTNLQQGFMWAIRSVAKPTTFG